MKPRLMASMSETLESSSAVEGARDVSTGPALTVDGNASTTAAAGPGEPGVGYGGSPAVCRWVGGRDSCRSAWAGCRARGARGSATGDADLVGRASGLLAGSTPAARDEHGWRCVGWTVRAKLETGSLQTVNERRVGTRDESAGLAMALVSSTELDWQTLSSHDQ